MVIVLLDVEIGVFICAESAKFLRKLVALDESKAERACFIIDTFCSRMFNHENKKVVDSENMVIPFVSKKFCISQSLPIW